jgi:L-seryl-tRNA(Ser) seleniumtransferase
MNWVEATAFPTYGVGRMFKVGREEIVGLWAAVEEYVAADQGARAAWAEERIAGLARAFQNSAAVSVQRVYPNEAGQPMPQAVVRFRASGKNKNLSEPLSSYAVRRFAEGEPSIFTVAAGEDGVFVNPMTLRDEEFEIIARRIGEIEKELEREPNRK